MLLSGAYPWAGHEAQDLLTDVTCSTRGEQHTSWLCVMQCVGWGVSEGELAGTGRAERVKHALCLAMRHTSQLAETDKSPRDVRNQSY